MGRANILLISGDCKYPKQAGELKRTKGKTMKGKQNDDSIFVTRIEQGSIDLVLVGRESLIIQRLAEKAKRELLYPKGRKTSADKATSKKHEPLLEYRAAAHRFADLNSPTLLAMPAAAPKLAMAAAALDMPGAKKAQIGRLSWVPGEKVPVYGKPKLLMSVVRCADMNHTPDIRTRVIVPEWAIPITVQFASPLLKPTIIVNLLVAAGMYCGIGDWRNQKGSSNHGQFDVMSVEQAAKDERVQEIMKQGRAVQAEAMENPEMYDGETAELYEWFYEEDRKRGIKAA